MFLSEPLTISGICLRALTKNARDVVKPIDLARERFPAIVPVVVSVLELVRLAVLSPLGILRIISEACRRRSAACDNFSLLFSMFYQKMASSIAQKVRESELSVRSSPQY